VDAAVTAVRERTRITTLTPRIDYRQGGNTVATP
jgi:hypothetical protein